MRMNTGNVLKVSIKSKGADISVLDHENHKQSEEVDYILYVTKNMVHN